MDRGYGLYHLPGISPNPGMGWGGVGGALG